MAVEIRMSRVADGSSRASSSWQGQLVRKDGDRLNNHSGTAATCFPIVSLRGVCGLVPKYAAIDELCLTLANLNGHRSAADGQ